MERKSRMVGECVRDEQMSLEGRSHERAAAVGCLDPQKPSGSTQIDEIDGGAYHRGQTTTGVEQLDRVQRYVEQDRHVDVAGGYGLPACTAAVQPGSLQPPFWKCSLEFEKYLARQIFDRDHG